MNQQEFLQRITPYANAFQITDLIKHPIHFITPDGIVQYVNQAWVDEYKVPLKEVLHRHISSIDKVVRTMNYYISFDEAYSPGEYQRLFLQLPENSHQCPRLPSGGPSAARGNRRVPNAGRRTGPCLQHPYF